MTQQTAAPDVESSHAPGHVADEVEPLAIRTDGRMCIAVQRIAGDNEFLGFTPGCVTTIGDGDGCIAGIVGVRLTQGKIHRLPVRREAAGPFVVVTVQFRVDALWFAPLPFVVFLRHEDISRFSSRDAAVFIALRLVACGGEVELVVLLASQHG